MSNYSPSSLQLADVAGTFVDQRQRRRRDKVLVLAMIIYNLSYPMLLNCYLVFYQSEIHTSNSLEVVMVIYI